LEKDSMTMSKNEIEAISKTVSIKIYSVSHFILEVRNSFFYIHNLHIKSEVHHIAIGNYIFFAFDA
jgi:hypothetical protein